MVLTLVFAAFTEVYNKLTFWSCDSYFRALGEVQLRIGRPEQIFPNRRRLQEEDPDFLFLYATNSTNTTNTTTTNTTNTTNATEPFTQVETYVGSTLFSGTYKWPGYSEAVLVFYRMLTCKVLFYTDTPVAGSCRDCPVSEAGYFNVSPAVMNS